MNKSKMAIVLFTTVLLAACEGMPKNFPDLKESLKGRNPDDEIFSHSDVHSIVAKEFAPGPEKGSVHELYPFQLPGKPNNMVEEIQINGRGEFSGVIYSCTNQRVFFTIFGNLAMSEDLTRPKDWPAFGFVSSVKKYLMSDDSYNYSVNMYISLKHPAEMRTRGARVYQQYTLDWNDEVMSHGAMRGRVRAGEMLISGMTHNPQDRWVEGIMQCHHIVELDKIESLKEKFAVWTMTPEQLSEYRRLNPHIKELQFE